MRPPVGHMVSWLTQQLQCTLVNQACKSRKKLFSLIKPKTCGWRRIRCGLGSIWKEKSSKVEKCPWTARGSTWWGYHIFDIIDFRDMSWKQKMLIMVRYDVPWCPRWHSSDHGRREARREEPQHHGLLHAWPPYIYHRAVQCSAVWWYWDLRVRVSDPATPPGVWTQSWEHTAALHRKLSLTLSLTLLLTDYYGPGGAYFSAICELWIECQSQYIMVAVGWGGNNMPRSVECVTLYLPAVWRTYDVWLQLYYIMEPNQRSLVHI